MHAARNNNLKKTTALLQDAYKTVPGDLRFAFLDGVLIRVMELPAIKPMNHNSAKLPADHPICGALLPLLEQEDQGAHDVLCMYYGALLLLACDDRDLARSWLEKTLLVRDDFWPARLELIYLGMEQQDLLPGFHRQLDAFIEQARNFKRFVCRVCGLKREQVFYVCPRCQSWHSIGFRFTLQE